MSPATAFHAAIRAGDLAELRRLLALDPAWANCRSETDPRGTYPLHVAAEFGQAEAALLLLDAGADVALLDDENAATALGWAAFYGRPAIVRALLAAGSDANQRNKHGLTPLGCAEGGVQGHWRQFSQASPEEWAQCAAEIRARGGTA